MAPDPRVSKAFSAMKALGISAENVKPVLKKLIRLYDKNWELIEEDNYRTLADAIFEFQDEKLREHENNDHMHDEPEPPLKRPNSGVLEDDQVSSTGDSIRKRDIEEGEIQNTLTSKRWMDSSLPCPRNKIMEHNPDLGQVSLSCRRKGSNSSNIAVDRKLPSQQASCMSYSDQLRDGTGDNDVPRKKIRQDHQNEETKPSSSSSLFMLPLPDQQQHHISDKKRLIHRINDITKGTEKVKISLLDDIGNEKLPDFVYIPQNIVYQDAYVPFSLARIADEDCCSSCVDDCLSSSVPCACARDSGGEFAYTPEGLLKEEFLNACISMNRDPQKHHFVYCQDCPIEREKAKSGHTPEPCKGHLVRKFIKECWRKCGCSVQCGNRVVQRGIICSLQVFLTEGKGWGLRTLKDLPIGSFVCEYVGEILTNTELYERNLQNNKKARHTYPVYLEADWASEKELKDEEALCLDATYYGNVARFINHRCFDGNLLEIPVEVETPDHHYYHIAFFTKRNVGAYEELTWDYGIDFDDVNHPIEAFHCHCGSSYCRDVGRKETKAIEKPFKRPTACAIIPL